MTTFQTDALVLVGFVVVLLVLAAAEKFMLKGRK
jgi:hypothetical protein